jgi:hypothetical protein
MQIWYKLTRKLETHLQDGYAWMETASRARTTTAMRTECASFWCIFLLWCVCFLGCCYSVTLLRLFVLKEMSIPTNSRLVLDDERSCKKSKRSKNFHSSLKTPFNKKIKCWGWQLRRLHFGRNWWLCVGESNPNRNPIKQVVMLFNMFVCRSEIVPKTNVKDS